MNTAEPVVYVIDDDKGIRSAVKNLLESVGLRVEVCSTQQEYLKKCPKDASGCLVLDVRLPGGSGLEFQRELAGQGIEMPIIFITGHGDIPMTVQAMRAGAVDFLAKPFRDQDLLDAIQKAIERDRTRWQQRLELTEYCNRYETLSPREREVMKLVVAGLLNKQIAAKLGTSETTVKIQRGQVMRKMEVDSLPGLVRIGETLGVLAKGTSSSS
jgi:FixJ family two-component response regulator